MAFTTVFSTMMSIALMLSFCCTFLTLATSTPSLTVTPISIEDDTIPLTVKWSGITKPTSLDALVAYLVPNSYNSGKFPIPAGETEIITLGYFNISLYDPSLTGSGSVEMPIFFPRDQYSFYFEYLHAETTTAFVDIYPHNDAEFFMNDDDSEENMTACLVRDILHQKDLLYSSIARYTVLAYSSMIPDALTVSCSHFRLSFTHTHSMYTMRYTTTTNDFIQYLHITTSREDAEKDIYPISPTVVHRNMRTTNPIMKLYTSSYTANYSTIIPIPPDHSPFATFSINEMREAPANSTFHFINPGFFRSVNYTLPFPQTKYFYRIRNANGMGISKVQTTYSEQSQNTHLSSRYTDLFVFGDAGVGLPFITLSGQQFHATNTYKSIYTIIAQNQEFYGELNYHTSVLNVGDLSYSIGYSVRNEYWMKFIEPISATFPWMITMGNHEIVTRLENPPPLHAEISAEKGTIIRYNSKKSTPIRKLCPNGQNKAECMAHLLSSEDSPYEMFSGTDSGGEGGIPFYRRFEHPLDFHYTPYTPHTHLVDNQTKYHALHNQRNIAYSYDVGVIHIIVISSEHSFDVGSAQYKFVELDAGNVNRTKTPFVILALHRPPYCMGEDCPIAPNIPPDQRPHSRADLLIRKVYTPLMKRYKIHLSITGHVHHVSRTFPIDPDNEYTPVLKFTDKSGVEKNTVFSHHGIQHIYATHPVHLVSGGAGNPFDNPLATYERNIHPIARNIKTHDKPEWELVRIMGIFGYHHIHANMTHLTVTFYNNEYHTIHDQFVLVLTD